ncbi:MAG: hypothetical protein M3088_04855 [Actinomycetota bacterium]|nr:hypothetical protein [Actinomycetota bacterium]
MPDNLPALLYARKVLRRAERVGRGADGAAALEHLKVHLARLDQDGDPPREGLDVTIGETLLAVVELAAAAGVDPELGLRAATKRRERRIGEDVAARE